MKKTTLVKILSIVCSLVLLCFVAVVPVAAQETINAPTLQIKSNINANQIIRTIFNWLIAVIMIVCLGIGGFHVAAGQGQGDTKERNGGIITMVVGVSVGGLMLVILNMILV